MRTTLSELGTRVRAVIAAARRKLEEADQRRRVEFLGAGLLALTVGIVGIVDRAGGQRGPKVVGLERVGSFREPVFLTQPPGSDALVVVERKGRLRVIEGGAERKRPLLDLTDRVKSSGYGGEQGLLSVAFAPDFERSGRLYLTYTDRRNRLRLVEFEGSDTGRLTVTRGSARSVLTIPQPTPQHHAGALAFGPDDRLYMGVGDGGPSGDPKNVAQDRRVLRGKILRIDPRPKRTGRGANRPYSVPRDNPYASRPGADEIYAIGFRNPWRLSFDRATGAFTVGDVGNSRFEEVNHLPPGRARGANFGWAAYEAQAPYKGGVPRSATVEPALAYPHGPGCSVIGGYVVRDPRLSRVAGTRLVGRYLFGDYCSGRLFALEVGARGPSREQRLRFRIPQLSSFGEDRQGHVYVISARGGIWRLVARRKSL